MKLQRICALCVFAAALGLYAVTAAPGIYWEDSAAFQTSVYDLGIVHNPSFPAYILMAKAVSHLPIGAAAFRVTLFSALLIAASLVLIFILADRLARRVFSHSSEVISVVAALCVLCLAVTSGVWVNAIRAEVYALNFALICLLLWLIFEYFGGTTSVRRFALLAGLLCGLGFTNHYLIFGVVALPILVLILIRERDTLLSWKPLAASASTFFGVLALYLYLPLREPFDPTFNWGDFSTVAATVKSILRLDEQLPFAVGGVTSPYWQRLGAATLEWGRSVPAFILALSALGLFRLVRLHTWQALLLAFPLLGSLLVTAYATDFSVYNLDLYGYLLPAYAAVAVLSVSGAAQVVLFFRARVRQPAFFAVTSVLVALLVLTAADTVRSNFSDISKSDFYVADRYAETILAESPREALFLAGEDNSFSPALCKQTIDQLRPDVAVLSTGALLRTDYRRKMQNRHSHLWYPSNWSDPEFAQNFHENLADWIRRNAEQRSVLMTLSEWTSPLIPELAPSGILFAYAGEGGLQFADARASRDAHQGVAGWWKGSRDITTREHFGRLLYNQAVFYFKRQQPNLASVYAREATDTDNTNVPLLVNCLKLFVSTGNLSESERTAEAIISIDPDNEDVAGIMQHVLARSGVSDEQ